MQATGKVKINQNRNIKKKWGSHYKEVWTRLYEPAGPERQAGQRVTRKKLLKKITRKTVRGDGHRSDMK